MAIGTLACSSVSQTPVVGMQPTRSPIRAFLNQSWHCKANGLFFPNRFLELPDISATDFERSFDNAQRISVQEFPIDPATGARHRAGTLVARLDTSLSEEIYVGLEFFENATAHRIRIINNRDELVASVVAGVPGESADEEEPAWKSVSVQFVPPVDIDSLYIVCRSRRGIIPGLVHGKVRCCEKAASWKISALTHT